MITENDSPVFAEPTKWTKELNDFLAKCLMKNPDERPTAKEQISHPWINQKRDSSVLIDLLDEYKDRKSTRKSGSKKKSKTPTATESDLANSVPDASLTSSTDMTLDSSSKPKKKKKVKFADNVKDQKNEFTTMISKKKKKKIQIYEGEKLNPEFHQMPANRAALYHGILRDRVHRIECSY